MPDLIFDLGANGGEDTGLYLHLGYRVLSVEANPLLAAKLAERYSEAIAAGRLTVLNVGIGAERGTFQFWVNRQKSEWSSFDHDLGCREYGGDAINVQMVRLSDLIAEHGVPHYAKIDIEGNDTDCLRALTRDTAPPFISVEMNHLHLLQRLAELGYQQFALVNQSQRLGSMNGWECPYGSSGPFGDAVQRWESLEWVTYRWLHWKLVDRDPNVWFDVHARLSPRD